MKQSIILLICLISSFSYAQKRAEWGLKGGVSLSNFRGSDFNGTPLSSSSTTTERVSTKASPAFGYTLGGYVRSVEDVFLQAELLFSMKGAQIDRFGSAGTTSTQVKFSQIDIPLSVGYKHKKVEVLGGLFLSTTITDDGKLTTFLSQYAKTSASPYKTLSLGYHIGAGINLNRLSINARFMGGIQPLVDETIYYNDPNLTQGTRQSSFQQRADAWQFTIGYKIK